MNPDQNALSLNREDVIKLLGGGLKTQLKSKPEYAELLSLLRHIESKVDDDLVKAVDRSLFPKRRTEVSKPDGAVTYIPPGKIRLCKLVPPEGSYYQTGRLITGHVKTAQEWETFDRMGEQSSSTIQTNTVQGVTASSSGRRSPQLGMGMEKSRHYRPVSQPVPFGGLPAFSGPRPGFDVPYEPHETPSYRPHSRQKPRLHSVHQAVQSENIQRPFSSTAQLQQMTKEKRKACFSATQSMFVSAERAMETIKRMRPNISNENPLKLCSRAAFNVEHANHQNSCPRGAHTVVDFLFAYFVSNPQPRPGDRADVDFRGTGKNVCYRWLNSLPCTTCRKDSPNIHSTSFFNRMVNNVIRDMNSDDKLFCLGLFLERGERLPVIGGDVRADKNWFDFHMIEEEKKAEETKKGEEYRE